MTLSVPLKCTCGVLRGVANGISKSGGNRIVCMCDDCQAYAHFLGRAREVLDDNGGTDVFPVTPSNLKITHGIENLKCLRLTDKGMIRWYSGCCNTPIANSMPSFKVPFAGVIHTIMDHAGDTKTRDEALGPIRARIWGKYGIGKLPQDAYRTASLGIIFRTLRFLSFAWLKRQHTPSPFFDSDTGKPKVEPYILTSAERDDLRKLCGPKPTR
jgi:hypothetical protein